MTLALNEIGCIEGVSFIPSPNFDNRPKNVTIDLLVIHSISLPPGEFGGTEIIDLFTNQLNFNAHPYFMGIQRLHVSAHFLIRRTGEILQFVPCMKRAWHAGQSSWQGRTRCNDFSIGIELEGADDIPFEEVQYQSLTLLSTLLLEAYPIQAVVGHADIAPNRKTDPGPFFDGIRYQQALGQPFLKFGQRLMNQTIYSQETSQALSIE